MMIVCLSIIFKLSDTSHAVILNINVAVISRLCRTVLHSQTVLQTLVSDECQQIMIYFFIYFVI